MTRFVSECCEGERCFCGAPAEHKVAEVIFDDEPKFPLVFPGGRETLLRRHELTAYICHKHFRKIMGPAAGDE